jgi:Cytochrome c
LLLLLGVFLNGNATAEAAQIPVIVISARGSVAYPAHAAVGLFVPGAGATVTRAAALAALERGRVENAVLGGEPEGRRKIQVRTGEVTSKPAIYVSLPPPGRHENTHRYGIVIVAPGYRGILTSSSTRIPGLVSIADVAQTAKALAAGDDPVIRSRPGDADDLSQLDRRLTRAHDVRDGALGLTAGLLATLGAIGYLLRSRFAGCAAVLFGAAAVTASLITSGAGLERVTPVLLALGGISLAFAAAGARLPRTPVVVAALAALLVVLAVNTAVNSLGPIGPYPENGGRFYGMSNLQETLLLPPVLAAATGVWLVPLAAVTVLTVGWSHAGADGGGVVVFATALMVLALRTRGLALTPRRLALVAAGAVAVGLALVGLDAAFGGSSHVTRSVGSGSVVDELGHRLHLSYAVVTSSLHKELLFAVSIAGLLWLATHRDRGPVLDALLAGVILSLFVNDTPVDVAGIGALGGLALLAWERTRPPVDSRPMRRGLLALPVLALVLAGCGSEGPVRATPETVEGTIQQEAPGKGIFAAQGCNGCHTYRPAGSNAQIGPDLDNLPQYAKRAKKPLAAFVRESIVNPGAYVEKGYQNVMPKTYGTLPKADLDSLVEFLTKQR